MCICYYVLSVSGEGLVTVCSPRKADAIKRKRSFKDSLAPTDAERTKYWVLFEESMTFSNLQELSLMLEIQSDLNEEDTKALMCDGSFFDVSGDVSAPGFSAQESARLGDAHLFPDEQKPSKTPKTQKPKATVTVPKEGDSVPKVEEGATEAEKLTSHEIAKKSMAELSKKVGEGSKLLMDKGRSGVSPDTYQAIEQCVDAMKAQHAILVDEVNKCILTDEYYTAMTDRAAEMCVFYDRKVKYAKAIASVTNTLEKQAAAKK